MPGHDSASGAALRFAFIHHGAARSQSVARINLTIERELINAEKKASSFAEVLHRKAEYRQENQHWINYCSRMSMGARIRCIEIERIETKCKAGEKRIITLV